MTRFLILVTLLLVVAANRAPVRSQAWTPPPGSPIANREHPRIWITNATLPSIRARMASGGALHADAKTWQTWLDMNFAREWSPAEQTFAMLHYAFAYQLLQSGPVAGLPFAHSATEYAKTSRDLLFAFIIANRPGISFDAMQSIAAYDWIYSTLSSSDRAAGTAYLKLAGSVTDDGNPFVTTNVAVRANRVLAGIACAGDGLEDAWCSEQVRQYQTWFRDQTGVTRSESDLVGDDGGAGQGISYGFGHTMRRVLFAEEGYRTATGASLASHYGGSDTSFLRTQPQHFAYRILPWGPVNASFPGGKEYRFDKGQYMNGGQGVWEHEYSAWLNAVSGLYQSIDPNMSGLAQWLIEDRSGPVEGHYSIVADWVFSKFITGPSTRPTPRTPSSLKFPLSRRFKEGHFVFIGSWDDPNAPFVSVYANEWMRSPYGMSPFMAGGFEIHRKGPQVINQGGVSGHDWGGGGRAGASNMLIFPDRTLTASVSEDHDDEGGHRRVMPTRPRGSIDFVQDGPLDELDVVRYLPADGESRDVDYVYADVTRAYNSTRFHDDFNPPRVSEVVRQIVYFRGARVSDPVHVVVLDRASTTDVKFEKNWLFHTAGEPMVDGTAQAEQPVRGGHGQGHTTYTGATRVTATNTNNGADGRVWLTPLLPTSRKVVKIGGPDAAGRSWTETSHEYESPYGKRFPYAAPSADRQPYVGQYRIEIIPSTPALSDVFLNVIEVTDAAATSPTPTASLSGTGLVGARVGNRIAAFNRVTADVSTGSLTIDQAGRYRVLLADLVPNGEYEVTVGTSPTRQVASTAGTIYLDITATAGTRIDLKATGTVVAQPTPAPQATLAPQASAPVPAPPRNVRIR